MLRKIVRMMLSRNQIDMIKASPQEVRKAILSFLRVTIIFKYVSYPSVAVATIILWLFGALWYSPLMFGDIWLASPATLDSMDELQYPLIYALIPLATTFINALFIAGLAGMCGISGWIEGIILSIWLGIGLLVVSMIGGYVLLNTSVQVAVIDMSYIYIKTLILCLFAALWHKKDTQLPA